MTQRESGATIDIHSKGAYPASALSNFAPNRFVFRGVHVASMEGLLQSLKFQDAVEQRRVCGLAGREARKAGSTVEWRENWMLYWDGEPIARDSEAYQALLDEAYLALFSQNRRAAAALVATGDAILTHSIGSLDPTDTILTAHEFCDRLARIRSCLIGTVSEAQD